MKMTSDGRVKIRLSERRVPQEENREYAQAKEVMRRKRFLSATGKKEQAV